jgi:hypothetical protein
MKQNYILTIIFLLAMPLLAEEKIDSSTWHQKVTRPLSCEIQAEEGDAVLRVELQRPDEESLQEVVDEKTESVRYALHGEVLPENFHPGLAIIKKFDFEWEGKKIEIPKRFWNDLAGWVIEESPLKLDQLSEENRHLGVHFLEQLYRPRLFISEDKGTVLIEWQCPGDCDVRTTIRWIIGKSGAVMRHRHTPPHEC